MYTLLLLGALGALAGFCLGRCTYAIDAYGRTTDRAYPVTGTVLGGILGLLLGAIVAIFVMPRFVPHSEVLSDPARLVAMRGSEGLSGVFVLGTGSFASGRNFDTYVENSDGSVSAQQFRADSSVHVFEEPQLHGTGYWKTVFWQADQKSLLAPWAMEITLDKGVVRQELHVPVGTVKVAFDVK